MVKGNNYLDQKEAIRRMYTTIYSDNYHVVYCAVPKAACSNWKRIFMAFENLVDKPTDVAADKVHGWFYKLLQKQNEENLRRILNSYYTFFFVRDPYERLISAYRDKFTDPRTKDYLHHYKVEILRTHRRNLTEEEYLSGVGITFEEFILQLIKTFQTKGVGSLNEHWRPQISICFPCHINYDFIGHQETLHEDFTKVMADLNVRDKAFFPEANTIYKIKSKSLITQYFSGLSKKTLDQLNKVYEDDFDAFGYDRLIFN